MKDASGSRLLPTVAGLVTLSTGVLPIVGWLLNRPAWIRLHPSLDPMQFSTALGLTLCGLALLLAAIDAALPVVRGVGAFILLFGCWRLGELVMGVGSFIALPGLAGDSDAMPPNAALALLVAGLGLFFVDRKPFMVAALGAFASSLGGAALLGHLGGVEPAFSWGSNTRMAQTAALGFFFLGAGMWAVSRRAESSDESLTLWRRPILGGLATLAGAVLFWQSLSSHEAARLHQTIDWATVQIGAQAELLLATELDALSSLDRGDPASLLDRLRWRRQARTLVERPGLDAVTWIQPDGVIDPSQPQGWPARSLADLRDNDPAFSRSLQLAAGSRRRLVYGPISPRVGSLSFWLFAPTRQSVRPGIAGGLYDARALFEHLLAEVALDYGIVISADGRDLYRREPTTSSLRNRLVGRTDLAVTDQVSWQLTIYPSPAVVSQHDSRLAMVVLVGGGALALLFTAALYLRQIAIAQASTLSKTNQSLREQVDRSRAAEEEVRSLNVELEQHVRERTAELRRSNDDLRQFATFASHELRQPLGTLVVWLDLLQTTQSQSLGEEGRRYLHEMSAEVTRMKNLIEAQLAWAAASAEELQFGWIALNEVVDDLRRDLGIRLTESEAQLVVGELPVVRADRRQLYNVLRNLVENSIKYRRPDVPLVITIESRLPVEDWPKPMACEILVIDNGQGFEQDEAEGMFQLFERLQQRATKGTGVGLAICRRIIERLEGGIRAEGRPGEGATFIIGLPRVRGEDGDDLSFEDPSSPVSEPSP